MYKFQYELDYLLKKLAKLDFSIVFDIFLCKNICVKKLFDNTKCGNINYNGVYNIVWVMCPN